MKLTFKDLKQQKFSVDAEPSETIKEVKDKIQQEKGWEASTQKLIYSGKILQDSSTVESCKIEEKGFIVCMTSKPKPAPATSSSATTIPSTPAPAAATVATTQRAPVVPAAPSSNTDRNATSQAPSTPSPSTTNVGSTNQPADFNDPSALTLGAQREAAISNMESMGFARSEIDRAMRAAYFNPDRAVEYLLNGIPENIQQEQRQQNAPRPAQSTADGAASTNAPSTNQTSSATPADSTPTDSSGSAETINSADDAEQPINLFEAAAQAGRTGGRRGPGSGGAGAPGAGGSGGGGAGGQGSFGGADLGALGAGLGQAANAQGSTESGRDSTAGAGGGLGNLDFLRNNPQFQQLRQIVQTQPRMLEPILQQVGHGNPQLAALIGQNPDQFLQLLSEDVEGGVPLPPGAQEISVTEPEREAIERLCRLGFERDLAIQAYFACDKNEELAANFLFDQPDDDGGDEGGAAM